MGESRPEQAGSCPTPSQQAKDTTNISMTGWRIVMILALLTAIAATLLFASGLNPDAGSAQADETSASARVPGERSR